jgi:hypothetical protein
VDGAFDGLIDQSDVSAVTLGFVEGRPAICIFQFFGGRDEEGKQENYRVTFSFFDDRHETLV